MQGANVHPGMLLGHTRTQQGVCAPTSCMHACTLRAGAHAATHSLCTLACMHA